MNFLDRWRKRMERRVVMVECGGVEKRAVIERLGPSYGWVGLCPVVVRFQSGGAERVIRTPHVSTGLDGRYMLGVQRHRNRTCHPIRWAN